MQSWAAVLAALLDFGLRLLEKLDEVRAADFRRRVGSDACGVLGRQLGKNSLDTVSASTDKSKDSSA